MRRSSSVISAPRSEGSLSSSNFSEQRSSSHHSATTNKNGAAEAPRARRRRKRTALPSPRHMFAWLASKDVVMFLMGVVVTLIMVDLFLWRNRHLLLASSNNNNNNSKEMGMDRVSDTTMKQQLRVNAPAHSDQQQQQQLDENEDVDFDKEPIYDILRSAGVRVDLLDVATRRQLPTWSTIRRLYGEAPVIHGLERCQRFRDETEPALKFYGVAGIFNSGTNLLAELLIQNCQNTERMKVYGEKQKGMRWQVPWGKHSPAHYRHDHTTRTDHDVPVENSIPMITIRDPYNWLQSMCRHHYEAFWAHSPEYCPNIIPPQNPHSLNPVRVEYQHKPIVYKSLPHLWNEWYQEYMEVDYPRIFVRFEDLLFYGQNVTETLCQCGGGAPRHPHFKHISKSAKLGTRAHGNDKTTLVEALIRYGTDVDRLHGLRGEEIVKTNDILDDGLMKLFHYDYAEEVPN